MATAQPAPLTVGRATTVTFTVGHAPAAALTVTHPAGAALTVRGYGSALISIADLVFLTEAGDFLTLETSDLLLTA